jgi:CHAT domain-containing protein
MHAPGGGKALVAFGDPAYGEGAAGAAADPELRSLVDRRGALTALPSTRREVEEIVSLYGGGATAWLGQEATEERAKAIGNEARIIHFACHGVLDEHSPLDSALALSIPTTPGEDHDNGLLQAWEVFERVRIDADLVTLSACETALGKEAGGEGLIGLTRAFQYAGARAVLASLWSVGDASTAELMKQFYSHLRAGQSKASALRQAQVDLMRDPATRHPFHWAAFELVGDWR